MIHFAYPNVIPKKGLFIGCGRYGVLHQEFTLKPEYIEVSEAPNTPNRSHLEYALQLLAPASYDSDRIVVEKKDQPSYRYQGNSLDLAYFLAHTHRSKDLKKQVSGDIWCTGAIEVKDGTPFLHKVEESGFQLKLMHFLDQQNGDKLFIVPAANIQRERLTTAALEGAEVKSIHQLKDNSSPLNTTTKTILKVLPNELPELIDLLFMAQITRKGRNKWPLVGLAIVAAILSGWWFHFKPDAPGIDDIERLLQAGDLITAKQTVARLNEGGPRANTIWSSMNTPLNFEITMEVQKKGATAIQSLKLEQKKTDLTLSHEDDYRLTLSAESPPERLYLYVLQIDELDQAYTIFPNVKWKMENPIEADQWPVSIPSGREQWLYLDQLPPGREDGIRETLHVLMSPWRANDVEGIMKAIVTETDRNARTTLMEELEKRLALRTKASIPSIAYHQFLFLHE
jgi:hypothetical protein